MGNEPETPAVVEVAAKLRERIADVSPDTQLPPVREMAAEYGKRAPTVRNALEKLRAEGLVTSRQGVGWFTAQPPALEPDTLTAIMQRFDEICGELRTLEGRIAQREADRPARGGGPVPTGPRSRRRPQQTSP